MHRIAITCLAFFVLAGCSGPAADIGRLSDQDLPDEPARRDMAAQPAKAEGGLLLWFFGGGTEESTAPPEVTETAQTAIAETEKTPTEPVRRKRGGLFGLLGGSIGGTGGTDDARAQTRNAALAPPQDSAPTPTDAAPRTGFLGLGGSAPQAKSEIAFGTVLPYGRVAAICGVPKRDMGKKIAGFPDRRETFALYDSDPGNTAAHTFYLTGFDDGCARQFTASLAVFGSVAMHEQLRYGLPAEVQPYSDTDKAYETLKARVCRVPKRAPCGERISRLERDTVFLSIYERFGDNARWKNLLLHDGDLLAHDVKGG